MLDYLLIAVIISITVFSFLIVKTWRKKYFVKEIYIETDVTLPIFTITFIVIFLIPYFILSKDNSKSWVYLIGILILDLFPLLIYIYFSTTCIYLSENVLIKKNIFITKKMEITKQTEIITYWDRRIVKTNKNVITINIRMFSGNINNLISNINEITNSQGDIVNEP